MVPINWLFLYYLFILIFKIFNFLNYYLFLYNTNKNTYLLKFLKL